MRSLFTKNQESRLTLWSRILCALLSLAILLPTLGTFGRYVAAELPAVSSIITKDSLHFIIRHWHSESVDDTKFQGDESSGEQNFVVIEGYIVPHNGSYKFYLAYQAGSENEGKAEEILENGFVAQSAYVDRIDPNEGEIVLKAAPATDAKSETTLERFSGFSVSAGHDAVYYDNTTGTIKITYNEYVHLVKGHVFYINTNPEAHGSSDYIVFGSNDESVTGGNPEMDTAKVFTYKNDVVEDDGTITHKSGDIIIISKDNKEVACTDPADLPDDVKDNAVLTKFYSTMEGLHTDKTASAAGDGRTFYLDLEAWYSNSNIPNVGMILDASGSMAFAASTPKPINVRNILNSNEYNAVTTSAGSNLNWENYFLSETVLAKVLNTHNTDNSMLSTSGYSYFVYDPRDEAQEYTPLAYWEGGEMIEIDEPITILGYYGFDGNTLKNTAPNGGSATLVTRAQGSTADDKSYTANYNFNSSAASGASYATDSSGTWFNLTGSTAGIKLDATPSSGNFTVSFRIKKSTTANDTLSAPADILYIGPMSGNTGSTNTYYRVYRRGKSDGYMRGAKTWGSDIRSTFEIFDNTNENVVTFVIEDGSVAAAYVYQKQGTSYTFLKNVASTQSKSSLTGYNLIFNAFSNGYSGAPLYIDDIIVLDSALSAGTVETLSKSNIKSYTALAALNLKNTGEKAPTVAMNGENVIGSINYSGNAQFTQKGWYYLTHSGDWSHYTGYDTGKRLVGIEANNNNYVVTDSINVPKDQVGVVSGNGTNFSYTPKDTPVRFYVDGAGYLRCFFYTGSSSNYYASYVYELADSGYVKVESLQRALGSFVTELSKASPDSQVSAVRFSTDTIPSDQLKKLILQKWTKDAGESAGMLSLQRGEGGALDSDNYDQYNYGLTGSTSTVQGLQSFYDNLANSNEISGHNSKYLIIFTDGKDTDLDKSDYVPAYSGGNLNNYMSTLNSTFGTLEKLTLSGYNAQTTRLKQALQLATKLKDDGYTIYTVMLAGGPVQDGTSEYAAAHAFLRYLSGTKDSDWDDKENYFYSTIKNDVDGDASDGLTSIFTDEILSQIVAGLEDYVVQDYIDPRFDLVDVNGSVWHLNEGGKVVVEGVNGSKTNYTITNNIRTTQKITLAIEKTASAAYTDKGAMTPYLLYDSSAKMYYLKWTDQEIDSSAVGAEHLKVWNARVTVKSKDDFLGGNAVLSNGNDVKQNYVYDPEDSTASSGTANAKSARPSKGFPRTTVDVAPPTGSSGKNQTIYMGETLTAKDIADKIQTMLKTDLKNNRAYYYWEYLDRYAKKTNTTLEALIQNIMTAGESGYTIDYYYLDNVEGTNNSATNQTGTAAHCNDKLGTLTYTWTDVMEGFNDYPVGDGTTTDRDLRKSGLKVTYNMMPVDSDDSTVAETREKNNDKLVVEKDNSGKGVYKWDSDYKPVAYAEGMDVEDDRSQIIDESDRTSDGSYTTDIVSGEIALQMAISEQARALLEKTGATATYKANLVRNGAIVGTFEVTYDPNDPKTYSKDENGNILVNAKLTYTNAYGYCVQEGLPLGEYWITAGSWTIASPSVKGSTDKAIQIGSATQGIDGIFTVGTKYTTPKQYPAEVEGNRIYLGSKAKSGDSGYLNDRFGLIRVYLDITDVGNLTITKELQGNDAFKEGDTDETKFTFEVKLKFPVDPGVNEVTFITKGGVLSNHEDITKPDDATIKFVRQNDGTYTAKVTLKHGQTITIENLPDGTEYTVAEVDMPAGYEQLSPEKGEGNPGTIDGLIKKNEPAYVEFTNTKLAKTEKEFPATGGIGTWPFRLLGGALIVGAVPLLYHRVKFGPDCEDKKRHLDIH